MAKKPIHPGPFPLADDQSIRPDPFPLLELVNAKRWPFELEMTNETITTLQESSIGDVKLKVNLSLNHMAGPVVLGKEGFTTVVVRADGERVSVESGKWTVLHNGDRLEISET